MNNQNYKRIRNLKFITGEVTVASYAAATGRSIPAASKILRRYWNQGLLERDARIGQVPTPKSFGIIEKGYREDRVFYYRLNDAGKAMFVLRDKPKPKPVGRPRKVVAPPRIVNSVFALGAM